MSTPNVTTNLLRVGQIAKRTGVMSPGIPPTDPAAVDMGRRWYALIQTFTGGDVNLGCKMGATYRAEPGVMAAQGLDEAMFACIGQAMQAAGLTLSA